VESLQLILILLLTRPLSILCHELGHAIPTLLLTRQKVTVYLGSYGDPTKSLKLPIGKLEIWFRYNVLSWKGGLCVPSAQVISIKKQIIYVACGPLASLVLAAIVGLYVFSFHDYDPFKLFLLIFMCSAAFDFLFNIIPRHAPIRLNNGTITYNDGHKLRRLIRYQRLPPAYLQAFDLFNNNQFRQAAPLFETILYKAIEDEYIYRLAIASNLWIGQYSKALALSELLEKKYTLDSNDYCNIGLAKGHMGLKEEGLKAFNTSLALNPGNYYTLDNKAYLLITLDKSQEALAYAEKAIALNPDYAYHYSTRGLAYIQLGHKEAGLSDLHRSLELELNHSYGFRNLGIYHLKEGNKQEALQYLLKAKESNPDTHLLDELIEKASAQ
jgi:tetratricopeptide (TPR) repeat protein